MATSRQPGRRPLPLDGRVVHWVARGADLSIRLDVSGDEFQEVRITGEFRVRRPDGSVVPGDPDLPADLVPLLVLAGRTVTRASFAADLVVEFDDATVLTVPPHDEYEAWEVRGARGLLVVASPGGGEPAVWSPVTPASSRPSEPRP